MKTLPQKSIEKLKSKVKGKVILPADSGYNDDRKVWNAMIDQSPAVIVPCADAGDVPHTLVFARENGLEISIRGAGHNIAGNAVCDNGVMIDFSRMWYFGYCAESKHPGLDQPDHRRATNGAKMPQAGNRLERRGRRITCFTGSGSQDYSSMTLRTFCLGRRRMKRLQPAIVEENFQTALAAARKENRYEEQP